MSKRFKAKPEAFASKARNVFKKARGLCAVCSRSSRPSEKLCGKRSRNGLPALAVSNKRHIFGPDKINRCITIRIQTIQ